MKKQLTLNQRAQILLVGCILIAIIWFLFQHLLLNPTNPFSFHLITLTEVIIPLMFVAFGIFWYIALKKDIFDIAEKLNIDGQKHEEFDKPTHSELLNQIESDIQFILQKWKKDRKFYCLYILGLFIIIVAIISVEVYMMHFSEDISNISIENIFLLQYGVFALFTIWILILFITIKYSKKHKSMMEKVEQYLYQNGDKRALSIPLQCYYPHIIRFPVAFTLLVIFIIVFIVLSPNSMLSNMIVFLFLSLIVSVWSSVSIFQQYKKYK